VLLLMNMAVKLRRLACGDSADLRVREGRTVAYKLNVLFIIPALLVPGTRPTGTVLGFTFLEIRIEKNR
jgi:hypothetical protein